MDYLTRRTRRTRTRFCKIPSSVTSRATRWAATITRCCGVGSPGSPEKIQAHSASHVTSRVRRQRPGAGESLRPQRRPRLDRQAHQPHQSTRRLVFLSGRDPDRPAAAGGRSRQTEHCGTCRACIDVCPTQAIVGPHQLDATSLHFLSHDRAAQLDSRTSFARRSGNRIYGCDDCQLVCPWNKFARFTSEVDFAPRHRARRQQRWSSCLRGPKQEFLDRTEGSAIRRIGYECWMQKHRGRARECADAARKSLRALASRREDPSELGA